MPIFEYRCQKCDQQFERIVSSSGQQVECPQCGSKKTEKLLSSFAMSKGSGASAGGPPSCGRSGST